MDWDDIEKTFRIDFYNPMVIASPLRECEKIADNTFKVSNYSALFLVTENENESQNVGDITVEYYKNGELCETFEIFEEWERIRKEYTRKRVPITMLPSPPTVLPYISLNIPFYSYFDYYIIKLQVNGTLMYR